MTDKITQKLEEINYTFTATLQEIKVAALAISITELREHGFDADGKGTDEFEQSKIINSKATELLSLLNNIDLIIEYRSDLDRIDQEQKKLNDAIHNEEFGHA